jgi:hypothetical protein
MRPCPPGRVDYSKLPNLAVLAAVLRNKKTIGAIGGKISTHPNQQDNVVSARDGFEGLKKLANLCVVAGSTSGTAAAGVATVLTIAQNHAGNLITIKTPRDIPIAQIRQAFAATSFPDSLAVSGTTIIDVTGLAIPVGDQQMTLIGHLYSVKSRLSSDLTDLNNKVIAGAATYTWAADSLPPGSTVMANPIGHDMLVELEEQLLDSGYDLTRAFGSDDAGCPPHLFEQWVQFASAQ